MTLKFDNINTMTKLDQCGSLNKLLLPLILVVILLLGSLGFGYWAFSERSDLNSNIDTRVEERLGVETQRIESEQQNLFLEREKEPLKPYESPSEVGSIKFSYPKTWSGYVDEGGSGSIVLDGTFHPDFVPVEETSYALRIEVVNNEYDKELKKFDSKAENGQVKVTAYSPKNVDGVSAVKITGQLTSKIQGTMVLIQVRDKTLKMWTEADQFTGDFNKHVLGSLTFSP